MNFTNCALNPSMGGSSAQKSSSKVVWTLSRRQHGVVSRRQILDLGYKAAAIDHRLRSGRLHRVTIGGSPLRGVYALGNPQLTEKGRWMAAVLACGPGAVLSHETAAALMRIVDRFGPLIHLSMPGLRQRRIGGLEIHRPRSLEGNTGASAGIPCTSPIRTLIDLATVLPEDRLERAVNEAVIEGLVDLERLRRDLDARAGQRGVRPLRALLDRHTFTFTTSELVRLFVPIALDAGLPLPETQTHVNGYRVDFFFPTLGLVVETDGARFHSSALKQTRDRKREHAHLAAGLLPLRFTHWQVRHEPAHVSATLAAAAANREARRSAA